MAQLENLARRFIFADLTIDVSAGCGASLDQDWDGTTAGVLIFDRAIG
jgi:hypothetical protein